MNRCVSQNSHSSHLAQHVARASSFSPSHLSTTSLSTCTPVRLSLLSSHGDLSCADPSHMFFGPLAETHSPTGYEPKNLAEEDNSLLVKLMFFHRPSMTSTHDSADSIATPTRANTEYTGFTLYLHEREVSADRSRVYHSFR